MKTMIFLAGMLLTASTYNSVNSTSFETKQAQRAKLVQTYYCCNISSGGCVPNYMVKIVDDPAWSGPILVGIYNGSTPISGYTVNYVNRSFGSNVFAISVTFSLGCTYEGGAYGIECD